MRIVPKFLVLVTAAVLCGAALLLVACSDDDPADPGDGGGLPQAPFPVSPDSLVSLYRLALTEQDTLVHDALFASGFRYYFSDVDVAAFGLTTGFMVRTEALQAARNVFRGEDLVPGRDGLVPGVVRVVVHEFSRHGAWIVTPAGSPFPGTEVCRHTVRIDLERPFGQPTMTVFGDLDVYVLAIQFIDDQGGVRVGYQLAGLIDPQELAAKAESYTWGMAHYFYLDNTAPVANLAVRSTGTFPVPGYELSANGSLDLDSGLHPQPYRWRAAQDSTWTDWQAVSLVRFTYPAAGPVTMGLEVRDRWGVATLVEALVEVPAALLPFPADPDLLMANFRTLYDRQVAPLVDDMLGPAHVSYLDSTAIQAYPTAGTSLTRDNELISIARLFDGEAVTDPLGNTVAPVGRISFATLEKLTDWAVAGESDRVPGAQRATYAVSMFLNRWEGDDLQVDSVVDFYAAPRDSLHEEVLQDYWQLVAQDDLGPASAARTVPTTGDKAVLPLSWSGLKAMYREKDPVR